MNATEKMKSIINQFNFEGNYIFAENFGHGHINSTFAVYFKQEFKSPHRYILQKINTLIFKEPYKLMENIQSVTDHIRKKILQAGGDVEREVLNIIKTTSGKLLYIDEEGNYWRAYAFIDDAVSLQQIENPEHFYQSAKAFGKFQRMLSDFPADTLSETIPDFHNTKKRFEALMLAVKEDKCGRAQSVKREIEFAVRRGDEAGTLVDLQEKGLLPLRVTHNDTKLNNVMIDAATGKGICVIDLDTVMPGLALNDFGDSIRFGANTAAEDETDLNKVSLSLSLFDIYTKGFLEECGDFLTSLEKKYLPLSAKLMTFECGIRFLTDYLNGDVYFKIHRPEHNLDRCRTQFKLVEEFEDKSEELKRIVEKYS